MRQGESAARGVSLGAIIREALDEKLEREQPPLTFLGTGEPRSADTPAPQAADEHDAYHADDFRGRR